MEVKIEHKGALRTGILYLCCGVILAIAFYFTRDSYVSVEIPYFFVLLEVLVACWYLVKGKSYELLNAEGITVTSPLKTVTYPWQQVQKYGVDMVPLRRGTKVYLSQTEPAISVFTETKKLRLTYREDVMTCLSHYKGAPAYDKR